MVRPLARRGAIGAFAGIVAITGMSMPAAHADDADPFADAGSLTAWAAGDANADPSNGTDEVPSSLGDTPIASVAGGGGFTLAVDTAGKLTCFGFSTPCESVPSAVADGKVKKPATGYYNAGAVLDDGSVSVWGPKGSDVGFPDDAWPLAVPADLGKPGAAKDLAIGQDIAAAITPDGSVTAWGGISADDVPAALKQAGAAKALAVDFNQVYVLKTDGSLTSFTSEAKSGSATEVPQSLQAAGAVKAVQSTLIGAYALSSSGTVTGFGSLAHNYTAPAAPAALEGKKVDLLSAGWGPSLAVTDSGDVVTWDCLGGDFGPADCPALPDGVKGSDISAATGGGGTLTVLQRKVLPIAKPSVAGTPRVGSKLEGTAGTFSGGGTVTNQWFAGDTAIDGATGTSFTPTKDQAGKTLTLRTTATKGDVSVSSTSEATAAVADAAATTVKAVAANSRYGASPTKVAVTLTPSDATGTVEVLHGAKKVGTGTAMAGKATVTLSSKTILAPGTRTLTVKYLGDDAHAAGQVTTKALVRKAKASVSAKASTTSLKVKKTKAKVTITVKATRATPTGTVAVYKGSTKLGTAKVSKGKGTVTMRAFKRLGKAKLTVKYGGNGTVEKGSSSLTVTVRK